MCLAWANSYYFAFLYKQLVLVTTPVSTGVIYIAVMIQDSNRVMQEQTYIKNEYATHKNFSASACVVMQ